LGLAIFRKLKENKNINLGIDVDRKDNPGARWKKYGYDSPGTVKMVKDAAGIMHVIVYVGL
jgi:hypothetical protein